MLTNKAKYSLRAMCVLSALAPGDRLQAQALADRARAPVKFLEAILVDLRRAGFIESRRGQLGGHALARPAGEIMVGDVIRAIDGPLAPVRCASLSAYEPCSDCIDPQACALRALMRDQPARIPIATAPSRSRRMNTRQEPIHPTQLPPSLENEHEAEVLRAIRDTRFGTVEIVVHQSRIVQITRSEKVRFER